MLTFYKYHGLGNDFLILNKKEVKNQDIYRLTKSYVIVILALGQMVLFFLMNYQWKFITRMALMRKCVEMAYDAMRNTVMMKEYAEILLMI